MKIKLLGRRCLVKEEESGEIKNDLLIPDGDSLPLKKGQIVQVNDEISLYNDTKTPMRFQIDDSVMYASFAGYVITINNEIFKLLNEDDIICKVINEK